MKHFTKRYTEILKGIAVVLLLVHHSLDPVLQYHAGIQAELIKTSVSLSKLCVSIFVLLSGYGMYFSFEKYREKNTGSVGSTLKYVGLHLFRIYRIFWLTAGIMIVLTSVIKGNFADVYGGHPVIYLFLDLIGVSYLTKTPRFVNSWWYITAVLIYYCCFPAFYGLVKKLKEKNYLLLVILAAGPFVVPEPGSILVYGFFFVIGMILAERDVPNRFLNWFETENRQIVLKLLLITGSLVLSLVLRQSVLAGTGKDYYLDWLPTLLLILAVGELVSLIPKERKGIFVLLGRYSFEIYLIHGVLLKYYGKFIYRSVHCGGVLLRLLLVSLVLAAAVRWLEKKLKLE